MSLILDALEPSGRTPDGHVVVRLSNEDYVNSWAAGARRLTENLNKQDAPYYQNGRNQPEHLAQPLAVMCEVAVARHLGIPWDWANAAWEAKDHHRFRNNADVGANIEVRRVRSMTAQPSLRARQVGKGLILFVAYAMPPEFLTVKLLGWRNYDEAWAMAGEARYDSKNSGSRTLPQEHLLRCTCFSENAKHTCAAQQSSSNPAA